MLGALPIVREGTGRGIAWAAVYGAILLAWVGVLAMALAPDVPAGVPAAEWWAAFCAADAGGSGFGALWAMWGLMSAAMMLPTAVPAIRTFGDLPGPGGVGALAAGYLAVWAGAAGLGAAAQMALAQADWLDGGGQSLSAGLSAGLFALAAVWQFGAAKAACLARCRHPLTFFLQHWRPGAGAAFGMGLRLGAVCLGCCWALMGLGFVGGVMNLGWMGLATVLMTLEKLPGIGARVTAPLGVALLAGAGFMAAQAVLGGG